jgi:hypothetical protein
VAALETFANFPSTTVSSGGTDTPSSGATQSWTVASSAAFAAAATGATQFHVADPAAGTELILVTNVTGTTWTVTRGAESTTPVAHSGGFTVQQVVTAAGLGLFVQTGSLPLAVASGGTGQATQQAAIDALTGSQSAGKVLRSDGTHATLSAIQISDVPTLNQNSTGTAAGLSATLAVASGGTNATTAAAALASLGALPTAGGTMSGAIAMGTSKITGIGDGAAAQDAAAFHQIPAALPPNGAAAGDLGGSYPSPTVTGTHLSAALPVAQGGTGDTSLTAYALLGGGTTSTGALQQVTGTGTTGQVLTSQGASTLPAWSAPALGLPYALSLRHAMP